MMDRLLDNIPLPRSAPSVCTAPRCSRVCRSVDVLPVFPLHEPRKPCEDEEEQHHPYAQLAPLNLRRLADVIEEVDRVTHELVVLLGAHLARGNLLKVIEYLLGGGFPIGAVLLDGPID